MSTITRLQLQLFLWYKEDISCIDGVNIWRTNVDDIVWSMSHLLHLFAFMEPFATCLKNDSWCV